MHLTQKNRTMPWAAAAASLTFGAGACGGDDGPPSNEDLAAQAERFAEALCAKYNECFPEDLADEFGDVEACEEYYTTSHAASVFEMWSSSAEDPEACRTALGDYFKCLNGYYSGLSCADWDGSEEYVCDAEYYAVSDVCPDLDDLSGF